MKRKPDIDDLQYDMDKVFDDEKDDGELHDEFVAMLENIDETIKSYIGQRGYNG